jgi:hypothetical protein
MTITLRNTKGSELTFAELDGNFTDLDGRITSLPDSAQVAGIITGQVDSAYVQAREGTPTITINRFDYTADSGDTVFAGSDDNGNTLSFDSATTQVYLNGLLLNPAIDYTLTLGNTVTTVVGIDSSHLVTITSLSVS